MALFWRKFSTSLYLPITKFSLSYNDMISFDWCIFWFSDNLLYCLCVEKNYRHKSLSTYFQYLILKKSSVLISRYILMNSLKPRRVSHKDERYPLWYALSQYFLFFFESTTQKRCWLHDIIGISSQFSFIIWNMFHSSSLPYLDNFLVISEESRMENTFRVWERFFSNRNEQLKVSFDSTKTWRVKPQAKRGCIHLSVFCSSTD